MLLVKQNPVNKKAKPQNFSAATFI